MTLAIGSLCSGIDGLGLGLEWSGVGRVIWQVEKDAACRAVLARHWPDVERFEDVHAVGAANLAYADLICAGFPCQNLSSAGKRAGLAGARSGLWYECARVIGEMRPKWVVIENVASGARAWIDSVRGDLGRLGYASLPIPLEARDCGAPHERARVFVIAAHADGKSLDIRQAERREDVDAERHRGWSVEPDVVRVVHGLPGRMDRQRMLGNSVVPQCAEVIGNVIIQLMERAHV